MDIFTYTNAMISAIGAVILSTIVLHPGIKEGLVIKVGLIMMIFSLGATFGLTIAELDDCWTMRRTGFILRTGMATAGLGGLWMLYKPARFPRAKRGFHG